MDRLEEINKQIAELEAQREELLAHCLANADPKLKEYYQDALKLKGKYIRWNDNGVTDTLCLAKVSDVRDDDDVELILMKFFMLCSDGTFYSDTLKYETYARYSTCTGLVNFKGSKFKVISESEYIEFIHDIVDKFCQGGPVS